ncbi:MAG: protein kinase [Gemmataceae bacterium]
MSDVESIFFAALQKGTPTERDAFLAHACNGNVELRRRVEVLLAAQPQVGSFLERPAGGTADYAPPVAESLGTVVAGKYKLLEAIGEGGMGSVFMAQQTAPVKRMVALKLIKLGMDSKAVLARFEAERQALALMDHPNIAKVLDAGTTESGRPYFVMELVKGTPITKFCDDRKLSPRERLELFIPVCQALQHAHQKGVIHRDVKPSNVLVALYDGRPVPKVIDFGVAKAAGQQLTDKTLFTGFGAVVGTPEYMSPEQAEVNQLDIDTRSDVYALGVMLYELMTGTTPIDRKRLGKAALLEILRLVREEEAPRPSTRLSTDAALPTIAANRGVEPAKLTKLMRGELDWILLRALEKDRTRRYETANGLARDIQRYLADEPVEACPPGAGYRLRKFVRRNKARVVAASAVALAAVVGFVGIAWGLVRANRSEAMARENERIALTERDEKEQALGREREGKDAVQAALAAEKLAAYDMTIPLIQKAFQDNDPSRAAALLATCPPEFRGWEWNFLTRLLDRDGLTLRPAYSNSMYASPANGTYRFTADGKAVVSVSSNLLSALRSLYVHVWDTDTGATASQWELLADDVTKYGEAFALSPDARWLAVWRSVPRPRGGPKVADPQSPAVPTDPPVVTVFDVRSGKVARRLTGHTGVIGHVVFNDDGRRIATAATDRTIRIWDDAEQPSVVLSTLAMPLAFLPDGTGLVAVGDPAAPPDANPEAEAARTTSELTVWDLAKREPRVRGSFETTALTRPDRRSRVRFGPDGRYALVVHDDRRNVLFDLTTGKPALDMPRHTELVGFAGQGKTVLGYTSHYTLEEIDIATGRTLASRRLPAPITARSHAVAGNVAAKGNRPERTRKNWAVSLSRDGTRLAAAVMTMGNRMTVVEVASGIEVRSIPLRAQLAGESFVAELSDDGNRLLTVARTGEMRLWDLRESSLARPLIPDRTADKSIPLDPRAVSADGRYLAAVSAAPVTTRDGQSVSGYRLDHIDLRTGQKLPTTMPPVRQRIVQAEYSPDGRRLAVLLTGGLIAVADGSKSTLYVPVLSEVPGGQVVMRGKPLQLAREDIQRRSLKVPQVGFAADGTFLVASYVFANDGRPYSGRWEVRDVAADRVVFATADGEDHGFEFVPGGRRAFVAGQADGGFVELWDMASNTQLWRKSADADEAGSGELASHARFSPDGRRMLTFDRPPASARPSRTQEFASNPSRRATVWDVETGRAICPLTLPSEARLGHARFSPDGRRILLHDSRTVRAFAILYDADTGRDLLSLNDLEATSAVEEGVFAPDGRFVCRTWGQRLTTDGGGLRVWDGRPTTATWTPERTIDELLAEAYRLCDGPDPAKRDPATALALTARAVAAYPDDYDCRGAHGLALLRAGKYEDSLAALMRQLKRGSGYPPLLVAQNEYLLAAVHHRLGHAAAAKTAFESAERLVREPVRMPNLEMSLAGSSRPFPNLAERPRTERYREFAATTLGIALDPLPPPQVESQKIIAVQERPIDRLFRAGELVKRGDIAAAVKTADDVLAGAGSDAGVLYNVACVYSLAAGAVKDDAKARGRYADQAVETLKRAAAAGLTDLRFEGDRNAHEQVKQDTDFDPIRERADFKQLLADLAAKPKSKEP